MVKPTFVRLSKQEPAITQVILDHLAVPRSAEKARKGDEIKKWAGVEDPLVKIETALGLSIEDYLSIFRVSQSTPMQQQAKVVLMITKENDATDYDRLVVPVAIDMEEQVVKLIRVRNPSEAEVMAITNPEGMPKPQLRDPQQSLQGKPATTVVTDSGLGDTGVVTSEGTNVTASATGIGGGRFTAVEGVPSGDGTTVDTANVGNTGGGQIRQTVLRGSGTDDRNTQEGGNPGYTDVNTTVGGDGTEVCSLKDELEKLSMSHQVSNDQEMVTILEQAVPEQTFNQPGLQGEFEGFRTHDRTQEELDESKLAEGEDRSDDEASGHRQHVTQASPFTGLQPARLLTRKPMYQQEVIASSFPQSPITNPTTGVDPSIHESARKTTNFTIDGVNTPVGGTGLKTSNTAYYSLNNSWTSEIQRKPQSTATKNGVEPNRFQRFTTSSLVGDAAFDDELEKTDLAKCIMDSNHDTRLIKASGTPGMDGYQNNTFLVNKGDSRPDRVKLKNQHDCNDRMETIYISMDPGEEVFVSKDPNQYGEEQGFWRVGEAQVIIPRDQAHITIPQGRIHRPRQVQHQNQGCPIQKNGNRSHDIGRSSQRHQHARCPVKGVQHQGGKCASDGDEVTNVVRQGHLQFGEGHDSHNRRLVQGNSGLHGQFKNDQEQHDAFVLSNQAEQPKSRPILKTQSQLVFPTWTGEGDPEVVISTLELFIELGYSEFETIMGFCTANQLTDFLINLPMKCRKSFRLFAEEFRKEYGINVNLAGAQFDKIHQRSDEKLSTFLGRVKRAYNASVSLPLETPLTSEAALVVRRKFLFGLQNRRLIKYLVKKTHWPLDSLPQRIRDLEKTAEAVDMVTEQQDKSNAVLWNSVMEAQQPQCFVSQQMDNADLDLCCKILPIHEQIKREDIPLVNEAGEKFCIRHNVAGHTVFECGQQSQLWLKTVKGRCDFHGWGGHTNETCRELIQNSRQHPRCSKCGGGHRDSECRSNAKGIAAHNKVRMGRARPKQIVDFQVNSGQNQNHALMTSVGAEDICDGNYSTGFNHHCYMTSAGSEQEYDLYYYSGDESSEDDLEDEFDIS